MNKFFTKAKERLSSENSFSAALTALVLAVVLVVNLLFYVLVWSFGLYFTTGEKSDLSLSGATDALFSGIGEGERVTIMFCQSEDEMRSHDTGSFVHETALNFAERYSFIDVEYVNIITKRNSRGERVDIDSFVTDSDGKVGILYPTSVIFTSKNNHRVMTDNYTAAGYADFYTLDSSLRISSYNGEEVIAAAITRVLSDEPLKTVYFTTFHGETADPAFYSLMTSSGYDVKMIDLRVAEVPSDAAMLVISNPIHDFERGSGIRTELERLESYLEGGGLVYAALDPIAKPLPELEKTISDYGITLRVGEDSDGTSVRQIIRDGISAITADGFTLAVGYSDTEGIASSVKSRIDGFGGRVIIKDAAILELDASLGAEPLLSASGNAEAYAGGRKIDSLGNYCVAATAPVRGEHAEGRIVVVSSVYLTAADALISKGYANKNFLFSLVEEFTDSERLPYNCRAVLYDTATLENLVMGTARIYTAVIMAIPAAIAVVGAVVIIRRKNR